MLDRRCTIECSTDLIISASEGKISAALLEAITMSEGVAAQESLKRYCDENLHSRIYHSSPSQQCLARFGEMDARSARFIPCTISCYACSHVYYPDSVQECSKRMRECTSKVVHIDTTVTHAFSLGLIFALSKLPHNPRR